MSTLDEMLRAPAEAALPPLVRSLKANITAGDELRIRLHRLESALGSSRVEMSILRREAGKWFAPHKVEWDDELNTALVNLAIRSIDLDNEGVRFALGLRAALRKVERRYGDGYLNAVLIDLIGESDLSKEGPIAEVLKFIHVTSPDRMSKTYSDCREQIASAIGARAAELREKLRYEEDELRTVMTRAIALYLDERFSVSRRRAMGWL